MPLALILIFGGVLAAYMGLNNVSLGGLLSDTKAPISSPGATASVASLQGNSSQVLGSVSHKQLASIGAKKGWGSGEIPAWMEVISIESGGNPNAQNPHSGAYGIAQFINGAGEYYSYGGNPNTVNGQLNAMANYIHERYGTPSAALQHEHSYGWY